MDWKTLKRVTRSFNLYRAPECRARARIRPEGKLSVSFSGTGAHLHCCFDEHFEDYRYHLLDLASAEFRIAGVKIRTLKPAQHHRTGDKGGCQNGGKDSFARGEVS